MRLRLNPGESYSILAKEGKNFFIDFADYLGEAHGEAYFQLAKDRKKYAIASPSHHLTEREDGVIKLNTYSSGIFEIRSENDLPTRNLRNVETLVAKMPEVQNA